MDEKGGTDANRSRAAFASLKPLWRSNIISLKTPGRGGGEVLPEKLKTVTLFMTKTCYIPYPIYGLTKYSIPYL